IKIHGFDLGLAKLADVIFTTHRDVRDLYGSNRHTFRTSDRGHWHTKGLPFGQPNPRECGSGDGEIPCHEAWERASLRAAFSWYLRWVPFAAYDMHYDDLMRDELAEIRLHARLLGFAEEDVDPAL